MKSSKFKTCFVALAVSSLFLTACKFEGGVFGLDSNDFLASKVVSSSTGVADNKTQLVVVLEFANSDGTKVSGFTPTFSAVMTGLTALGCTVTDSSGISTCRFTSSETGSTLFSVTNLSVISLQKEINFVPTSQPSMAEIVSGGNVKQTGTGGWTASSTIGPAFGQPKQSGSGFSVFVGFQGSMATQQQVK